MDELLAQLQVEAPELVQRASDDLLALERDPADRARLDGAFRAVHTLKGSVALFDMASLEEALHAAEDWLGAVRTRGAALDPARLTLLLRLLGDAERWIAELDADGVLPPAMGETCAGVVSGLRGAVEPPAPSTTEPPEWARAFLTAQAGKAAGGSVLVRYTPDPDCFFRGEDPLALVRRLPGLLALDIAPREPWPAVGGFDPFRCNLVLTALAQTTAAEARAVFRLVGRAAEVVEVAAALAMEAPPVEAAQPSRPLRIDPARVDALLTLVDDLVGVNAAFGQLRPDGLQARDLLTQQQRLDRLAGEMHAAVMRLRLAPLSRTFERLPRLARDLAARLGKPVGVQIAGGEVEADRTVVDALFEPLLHLVRNAIDHGIEAQGVRQAAGKPVEASIRITAREDGGELVVDVADDGGGVAVQAVGRRAVERGLIGRAAAETLTPDAAAELLFAPGFSTAEQVSEVSGRGVGLDAVRGALEALGGSAAIASEPGRGSVATLRAPMAAALTRLILVRVGDETYGAPIADVVEVGRAARDRLTRLGAGEAIVWRGQATPVIWLHERLDLPRPSACHGELHLLVTERAGERTVVVVDEVMGRTSGVLRPLSPLLADVGGLRGAVLTGEKVLFVLDLAELAA